MFKDLNINALFNLTSAAVVVFGYLWASLANNKRMDDFRQSMDHRMEAMQSLLLAEIRAVSSRLEGKIDVLVGRMDNLERRMDRLERQLEHPVVRP